MFSVRKAVEGKKNKFKWWVVITMHLGMAVILFTSTLWFTKALQKVSERTLFTNLARVGFLFLKKGRIFEES